MKLPKLDFFFVIIVLVLILFGFNYYKKYFSNPHTIDKERKEISNYKLNEICIETDVITKCYGLENSRYKIQLFSDNSLESNILIISKY